MHEPPLELFHAIADAGSAAVRRFVVERGLEAVVRFRNVAYPEAQAALQERGGRDTPALWDGQALAVGEAAVLARLQALAGPASA